MSTSRLSALGLAAVLLLGACASAVAQPARNATRTPAASDNLEEALRVGDIDTAQQIAANERSAEALLARAALLYWRRQDAQADPALLRAVADASLTPSQHRTASAMLAGLRLRQSRYAEAVTLLDAALAGEPEDSSRSDMEQTRAFAAALAGAPPMQSAFSGGGDIALTRDLATLTRAQLGVNGGAVEAIVDTGSGVSTLSESNAARLGVRMLPGEVSVGTSTSASATTKLAIADTVRFGGVEFHNVVFLVMPDAALTFGNGAYVVPAIIGMPILLELGRLEFRMQGATGTLHYARTGATPGADSNLTLESEEPFTFARVDGSERRLRLFIDNGARTSHLNRRFAAAFPNIVANAEQHSVTHTGGAGSETQDDALQIANLTLHFGSAGAPLTNVAVIEDHSTTRDGAIGQDVMRAGDGYVLDFEAMRFELLAPRS